MLWTWGTMVLVRGPEYEGWSTSPCTKRIINYGPVARPWKCHRVNNNPTSDDGTQTTDIAIDLRSVQYSNNEHTRELYHQHDQVTSPSVSFYPSRIYVGK